MAEEKSGGSSGFAVPPPSDERRNHPQGEEERRVVFVDRKISQERLDALRDFLKNATADDIATIRKMYGDNIEVLKLIGLEIEER